MATHMVRRLGPAGTALPWNSDFQRLVNAFFDDDAPLAGAFSPALDVEENDDQFTLHVELPGVNPADVDLSIEESVLTISGERDFYADKNADGFRRVERRFGKFHRSVRLPDRVDNQNIAASYKDGLLTVTVPKAESAKPRKIAIQAS